MGDDAVADPADRDAERRADLRSDDRADPDAMWKPGYVAPEASGSTADVDESPRQWFSDYAGRASVAADDAVASPAGAAEGEPAPLPRLPAATGEAPRPNRARRWAVAGLAVLVVGAAGVVLRFGHDGGPEDAHLLASIPGDATAAWSVEVDTGKVNGVIGTASTLVVLESASNDLVGLSVASGAERWRARTAPSNSIVRLDHIAGAAIVRVERNTGDRWIAAFDVESGTQLWLVNGYDRSSFTVFDGSIYRLPFGITDVVVERLDPLTGIGLKALGSEFTSVGWEHVATASGDAVEVFELRTLERVAGPLDIGDVIAASAVDGRVVALGRDAALRLYAPTGDELAALPITIDQPDLFDVAATAEPVLLVAEDHEIVAYTFEGDRIVQAWREAPVQINEVADAGGHTYAVVQTVVAAGPNGGPVRVIDVATGDVVAEPAGGNWVRLGRDGFLVEITDDEGVRLAVEGYGYDGDRRWRFDLDPDQQDLFLVEGAVVVVASDTADATSTLTYIH